MKKLIVILIVLIATCGVVASARTSMSSHIRVTPDSEAPL